MAAMHKNRKTPSLLFGPGDVSGWTPVGVSGFRGLKPTAAVRELIQNGLDAATAAAASPARMRFRVGQYRASDIPAIDSYREAFASAQQTQHKLFNDELPDNAKAITSDIAQCLKKDTCKVLYVLDNGIGLDKNRMRALLGDGLSVKESGATGSFGNGHVVVFPASDLRYVLYGGLSAGNMIGSGHAILASRENKTGGASLSKDGYFVKSLQDHDLFDRYVFPENKEIPSLIQDQLLWIKEQWGTGSVVAVIGFNRFRELDSDTGIQEQVFRAAACNFFEAIHGGHLVVEIEEDDKVACLDAENLHTVLEEYRMKKRSTDSFLSGSRAYEALLTLETGKSVKVKTEMGDMEIMLRYPIDEGITRVDLCRNGMWITDRLPKFHNQFGELQAFHCVLPLRKNISVNRLVRKTEGPLHNSLFLNQLSKEEKKQLNDVFNSIREKLHEEVPKLSNEIFRPDDILLVRTGELVQGGTKPSTTGIPTVVKRRPKSLEAIGGDGGEHHGEHYGKASGGGLSGSFERSGNQIQFQAVVVPNGRRSCRANIVSGERVSGSEIRFALDESIDVTSDDLSNESFVHLNADTLRLNGQPVQKTQLKKDADGNVLGVLLGKLDQRQECVLDMDYTVPDYLPIKSDHQVVLKIEMIRRAPQNKVDGE